jgi:membrane-associated phospholipid phosphatase
VTSRARGAAALVALAFLAVAVGVGALTNVDRVLLEILQVPHGSWFDLGASIVSTLGRAEIVGTVALGVAIVRRRAGRRDWWVPLLLIVVVAIELVLKATVPQEPPGHDLGRTVDVLPDLDLPTAFAFPSGHVARVAFLVAALRWPPILSVAIVLAVGLTRVYLGGHWPSDVVGGWLLGYGIAAVARARA